MKADIHPDYVRRHRVAAPVATPSRHGRPSPSSRVELCSECHPFYTGKQKLVDTGGRVERFERRYGRRARGAAPAED